MMRDTWTFISRDKGATKFLRLKRVFRVSRRSPLNYVNLTNLSSIVNRVENSIGYGNVESLKAL